MNYRHIYHAGNFADVVKHLVLMLVLERLKLKDTPFFVLDTHGGIGMYDLSSEAALKTNEAQEGVLTLADLQPENEALQRYIALVEHFNVGKPWLFYPGSPAITNQLIRASDRHLVSELHPDDVLTLKANAKSFPHECKVLHLDAYQAIRANLPPKERRGLVLIDPPFEKKDEFTTLAKQIGEGLTRWKTGTYMIWFPLKTSLPIEQFYRDMTALNIPNTLLIECWIAPKHTPDQLNGCGLLLLNTPWQIDTQLQAAIPELTKAMIPTGASGISMKWLVG